MIVVFCIMLAFLILIPTLSYIIYDLKRQLKEVKSELIQYGEVAGLSPIEYPGGRRLPDPDLKQDPAFLAFVLGELEKEVTTSYDSST